MSEKVRYIEDILNKIDGIYILLCQGDKKEGFEKLNDMMNELTNILGEILNSKEIVDMVKELNPYFTISIHQNSFTSESVHGAQCFYYQRSENSKRLGEIVQNQLNDKINTENPKKAKSFRETNRQWRNGHRTASGTGEIRSRGQRSAPLFGRCSRRKNGSGAGFCRHEPTAGK